MSEWLRASNSSSCGVWVWVTVVTLVSLSKTLHYKCFSSPRGMKMYLGTGRVEVDILYKKAFGAIRLPRLYTPQGAEKDRNGIYWPNERGTNLKCSDTVIVKCAI